MDVSAPAAIRGVPLQPEMGPAAVTVPKVRREDSPKMRLVHDDDVIETLPSNRAIRRSAYGFC